MFSQYVLNWGGVVSKLVQRKRITDGGEVAKPPAAERFLPPIIKLMTTKSILSLVLVSFSIFKCNSTRVHAIINDNINIDD